jgi:hypothetical protein
MHLVELGHGSSGKVCEALSSNPSITKKFTEYFYLLHLTTLEV